MPFCLEAWVGRSGESPRTFSGVSFLLNCEYVGFLLVPFLLQM